MAELAYRELYRISPQEARRQLVNYYRASGSIRATARAWKTSPREVRRWVRRWQADPTTDFADRSHRPGGSPRQTAPELEARVLALRAQTGYGRQRLARALRAEGYTLSADTIRHILHRAGVVKPRRKRKAVYPAHWAWEETAPFRLLQTDTKDVRDKGSLGSALVAHLDRQHLPRYQWTACEGLTRLRFVAYSHHLNSTNGLAFLLLVTLWLRTHGIQTPLTFQTDWGQEFGGDNPRRVAQLARYPLGRKGTAASIAATAPMMRSSIAPACSPSTRPKPISRWPCGGSSSTMSLGNTRAWVCKIVSLCKPYATVAMTDPTTSRYYHPSCSIASAPISSSPAILRWVQIH